MTAVMLKARWAWNWFLIGLGTLCAMAGTGIIAVLVITTLGAVWDIYERNSKPSINAHDLEQLKSAYERVSPRTIITTSAGVTLMVVCTENGTSRTPYTITSDDNLIYLSPERGSVPGLCWDNRIQLLSVQDQLREAAQRADQRADGTAPTGRNPLHRPR